MSDTRGERNFNPGNLRHGQKWQGLADTQPDPDFCTFKTPQWGIRAIARTILTYVSAYGLNTVSGIISRWAPPNENKTPAYIEAVSGGMKAALGDAYTGPDQVLDVDSVAVMLPLVRGIIRHENGEDPYPDSLVLEALHMAGVSGANGPPLLAQKTFITHAATGVAVAASAASQYAPQVKSAADQLSDYTGIGIFAHVHTVLLGLAGALVLAGIVAEVLKHKAQAA